MLLYTSSQKAREAGWFSRRHETDEAHRSAREAHIAKQAAKVESAQKRQQAAEGRSPEEQLKLLDERLGVDVGARKERAKLKEKIEASQ